MRGFQFPLGGILIFKHIKIKLMKKFLVYSGEPLSKIFVAKSNGGHVGPKEQTDGVWLRNCSLSLSSMS